MFYDLALPAPAMIKALDVRIGITEYRGTKGVDIRELYEGPAPDFTPLPSKRGIRLPIEYLPELVEHLTVLLADARAAGLVSG